MQPCLDVGNMALTAYTGLKHMKVSTKHSKKIPLDPAVAAMCFKELL